ncbi:unnamed protein product [Rotaria sordida]|uniref:PiggyBac transposable element-derived protein domain-containing protein n=2 Tax=Rotaria sordida TaxID=392033 RepID=A0A815XSA0_9BILA|nr:unnamed protein product [Rotaria sordida]CAF1677002.1 unnamed protein product [Rotaria sordida]
MDAIYKSNLKRIQEILLTDNNESDDIGDGQDSDSDSEYDPIVTESDDTSTNEHISEESDLSNSDIDQSDIATDSQPETLKKAGVTWSIHSIPVQGRISAANIMKKKPGSNTMKLNSLQWKPLDRIELESFIGLLIQSGVNKDNHELLSELWDISQSSPICQATMSLERYRYLLQFIRFDDRRHRDKSDHLCSIRFIFESVVKQLPRHFVPGENLTVDEQLVPSRDRCCFVQYMPKKSAKVLGIM